MIMTGRLSLAAFLIFTVLMAGQALAGFPENVRYAQEKLGEFGYDSGVPDGVWGPRTQRAMRKFQRDNGLPLSFELTDEFIQSLRAFRVQMDNFPPPSPLVQQPPRVSTAVTVAAPEPEPEPAPEPRIVAPPVAVAVPPSSITAADEASLLRRWTFARARISSVAEVSGPGGAATVKVAVRQKYTTALIQGRSPKDLIRGFYGSIYFRDLSRLCNDAAPVGGIDALELRQIIEDARETVTVATRTPMRDCRAYIDGTLSERGLMAKITILPE